MNKFIESLKCFKDDRGDLIPLEFKDLPFIPKRMFYISNVPENCKRGDHAHYETKQYIVCLSGEVDVFLFDGRKESKFSLKKGDSIYIPEMIWDYQIFKQINSTLVVFASTEYNKLDYIFSKDVFTEITK